MKHTHPFEGDTEGYIKYPLAHERELKDPLPAPLGQKEFNRKQSYKVTFRRKLILYFLKGLNSARRLTNYSYPNFSKIREGDVISYTTNKICVGQVCCWAHKSKDKKYLKYRISNAQFNLSCLDCELASVPDPAREEQGGLLLVHGPPGAAARPCYLLPVINQSTTLPVNPTVPPSVKNICLCVPKLQKCRMNVFHDGLRTSLQTLLFKFTLLRFQLCDLTTNNKHVNYVY